MKFIYMDESGKSFLRSTIDTRFIYGALSIERENVAKVLKVFKEIFKDAKSKVHEGVKKHPEFQVPKKGTLEEKSLINGERGNKIEKTLENFEIHSVDLFNPTKDKLNNQREIIKYNPWQFIDSSDRSKIIEDLFKSITPLIGNIYMFQIEKESFNTLFTNNETMKQREKTASKVIIQFVLEELNSLAVSEGERFALIMDTLEGKTRDAFVTEIEENKYPMLWAEPIVVESHTNAFIQLIDLFTYVFYLEYSGKIEEPEFKRVRNSYRKYPKKIIITKDFMDSLELEETQKEEKVLI